MGANIQKKFNTIISFPTLGMYFITKYSMKATHTACEGQIGAHSPFHCQKA